MGMMAGEVWGDWGWLASARPACPAADSDLFHFYPFLQADLCITAEGKSLQVMEEATTGLLSWFQTRKLCSVSRCC